MLSHRQGEGQPSLSPSLSAHGKPPPPPPPESAFLERHTKRGIHHGCACGNIRLHGEAIFFYLSVTAIYVFFISNKEISLEGAWPSLGCNCVPVSMNCVLQLGTVCILRVLSGWL